jgi:hypothetical protein
MKQKGGGRRDRPDRAVLLDRQQVGAIPSITSSDDPGRCHATFARGLDSDGLEVDRLSKLDNRSVPRRHRGL